MGLKFGAKLCTNICRCRYTIPDKGGYAGANFPGHIGPFGLHDWSG